jgi:hypothetical protein
MIAAILISYNLRLLTEIVSEEAWYGGRMLFVTHALYTQSKRHNQKAEHEHRVCILCMPIMVFRIY